MNIDQVLLNKENSDVFIQNLMKSVVLTTKATGSSERKLTILIIL